MQASLIVCVWLSAKLLHLVKDDFAGNNINNNDYKIKIIYNHLPNLFNYIKVLLAFSSVSFRNLF